MTWGLTRVVSVLLVLWAVGTAGIEPFQQAAAGGAIVMGAVLLLKRRVTVPTQLRPLLMVATSLALWQLVSPLWAWVTGVATTLPRSSRYGQVLDTLAFPALVVLAQLYVPWRWVLGTALGGWLLSVGMGMFQHLHRFPIEWPAWLKIPVWRMHQDFSADGTPRYPAGGLYFHRLRFAHGGIAMLGPALAGAGTGRGLAARGRAWAAVWMVALGVGVYASYARAALGTVLVVTAVGALLIARGRLRWVGVGTVACGVLAVSLSPHWRARVQSGVENLFEGERRTAMAAGYRLAREHPLLGVGFGNHQRAALADASETGVNEMLALDSHNLWLTAWAETGLIGLLLQVAFHLLLARALFRRWREGDVRGAAGLLAWVGFQVLSVVHYLPFHSSVMLTFVFVWGLSLSGGPGVWFSAGAAPAPADRPPPSGSRSRPS